MGLNCSRSLPSTRTTISSLWVRNTSQPFSANLKSNKEEEA
jgi:hypothetical protein